LWAEGVLGAQINLCMCAQYGDNVLSRRIVYDWIEMFENGRTSVTDAPDVQLQWCISGYALNQKHFFLMVLKSW
jgi:hypothetical protein